MTEEEEFEEFRDPLLRIKGMTPELAEALRNAGYFSLESIAVETPHFLIERVGEKAGLTIEKARELTRFARQLLPIKTMTVAELYEQEEKRKVIPTGCKALDEILDGGIHTHELTEAVGPAEGGKTELTYTTAINAIKQNIGSVWVLDTEATWNAHRLVQIAKARGLKKEDITANVLYDRTLTSAELTLTLERAHKTLKDYNVHYLIIDSLVSPFRTRTPSSKTAETKLLHKHAPKILISLRNGNSNHKSSASKTPSPIHY